MAIQISSLRLGDVCDFVLPYMAASLRLAAFCMAALALLLCCGGCMVAPESAGEPAASGPRKVIVGSCCYSLWGKYPGLDGRLGQLAALTGEMNELAHKRYGRSVDIAVWPEAALSPTLKDPVADVAFPLDDFLLDSLGKIARDNSCYLVAPLFLAEGFYSGRPEGNYSNAAVVVDRSGKLAGIYRKLHPVITAEDVREFGVRCGESADVIECDFGRLGVQICMDAAFDDGWDSLKDQRAELVVWPTQSPGKIKAAMRALRGGYYVLSSTWRDNASLFDPIGQSVAEISPADKILVEQIDLECRIIPWQPSLKNGQIFDEKFPGQAGYRYSTAEDAGVFWSNNSALPIEDMMRSLDLQDLDQQMQPYRRSGDCD